MCVVLVAGAGSPTSVDEDVVVTIQADLCGKAGTRVLRCTCHRFYFLEQVCN